MSRPQGGNPTGDPDTPPTPPRAGEKGARGAGKEDRGPESPGVTIGISGPRVTTDPSMHQEDRSEMPRAPHVC